MKVTLVSADIGSVKSDLVCLGVFQGKKHGNSSYDSVNGVLGGVLRTAAKDDDFSGKNGESVVLHTLGNQSYKRISLVGCGEAEKLNAHAWLTLGATAARLGNKSGAKTVALTLPESDWELEKVIELVTRGAYLGSYRYDKYRSDSGRAHTVTKLTLHVNSKSSRKLSAAMKRGQVVAESVAIGRDLVNEPPSDLYPETFAAFAKKVGTKVGLKVKILKPDQLKKMGMNLLLGVGQGSDQTPRLVHLSYTPSTGAKKKPIVLVGKGITFDSGGLSLKPGASMVDMKMDMGGAGAVLGAMNAIAQLKPNVPVHGLLALAENMPSGSAIRPGDVIKGASGRTVEINNTDAEGRLVLADALHYAVGLKPAKIIDLATLTGAVMVALGPHTVGCFSNDDELAEAIVDSSKAAGESFWRMPLTDALKSQLKSDIADTKNTGERWGGSITAALFLQEFVGGTTWAHLDIAGPAMSSANTGHLTKGGSGVAIATLVDHIC